MANKKKLLFVINSLNCGGAEKSLVSLLQLIDYSKYTVDLQMFNSQGMFLELLPKEVRVLPELEFVNFCSKNIAEQLLTFNLKFNYSRISLAIQLRNNRIKSHILHDAQVYWKVCKDNFKVQPVVYDVAIAWGQGNPTHYIASKVKASKKLAWINVNYALAGHNRNFDHDIYYKYDEIISVSDQLVILLKEVFPDMVEKMDTFYDINNVKLIKAMSEKETVFDDEFDGYRIVTVGRMTKQKGYDIATEACKLLKDKGLNFKWYIIGDGEEHRNIENDILRYGIKDRMVLIGSKPNPYPYMKNADVYVQTSRFEGYCLTIAEARILNTPVITTEFDVVYNQMIQEKNGLVVKMNSQAVADGIEKMISNNNLMTSIINFLKQEKKGNTEEMDKFYTLIEK